MGKLLIIDDKGKYSTEIKSKLEKNSYFSFYEIQILKGVDEAIPILEQYCRTEDNVHILIYYHNIYLKRIEELLAKYQTIKFIYKPKIFVYTDVDVNLLPEIIFTQKVAHLLLINDSKVNLTEKIVQYFLTHKNCSRYKKTSYDISMEQYVEQSIEKICTNVNLIGAKYLFLCCVICIKNPKKMSIPIKQLYYEVGEELGADPQAVDRSIRNLINKGVKNDNLIELCNYTNTDVRWLKVSNANVLSAIVLGYQNQFKKVTLTEKN